MNTKKNLITVAMVIVVLVAGSLLWRGGFLGLGGVGTVSVPVSSTGEVTSGTQSGAEGQTGAQGGEQTAGTEAKTGSIGKMTDDIYVDIMAQVAYQGAKDPMAWAINGFEKLLNSYGVTEENYTAYGNELQKDTSRMQTIVQKYSLKVAELQKAGK